MNANKRILLQFFTELDARLARLARLHTAAQASPQAYASDAMSAWRRCMGNVERCGIPASAIIDLYGHGHTPAHTSASLCLRMNELEPELLDRSHSNGMKCRLVRQAMVAAMQQLTKPLSVGEKAQMHICANAAE